MNESAFSIRQSARPCPEYTAAAMRAPFTVLRLVALLGIGLAISLRPLSAQRRAPQVPRFQIDALWPKPLPNHWILGSVTGVAVDGQDHIWLVHRGMDSLTARTEAGLGTNPPTAETCCAP